MIRCPSCDSTDTAVAGLLSVEPDQIADRRECGACGERWMMPARPLDAYGDVERIELGADDEVNSGDPHVEAANAIEHWFRADAGDAPRGED